MTEELSLDDRNIVKSNPAIEEIILIAVQKGAGVETMERLVELKERIDKMEAEKAFNDAFAKFQSECSVIPKRTDGARTKNGTVAFKYASLEDIESIIREPLTRHGFSYSWDSKKEENIRRTICTVTHKLGHSKFATFESTIDEGTSMMNSLQKEGSTIGYGKRNSLVLVLGLIMAGEDDDGTGATEIQLTDEQIQNIKNGIGGNESLYKKMLRAYNLNDLKYLPSEKYEECISRINTYLDKETVKKDAKN